MTTEPFSDLPKAGTESISAFQAPTDVVFVVDVHGPNITDGSPGLAARTVSEYGAVIDGKTHQVIEECIGAPCSPK